MTDTPRLLDQIVNLTAQRYIDVLEFSLLKTLYDAVVPTQLRLLKFDSDNSPVLEIIQLKRRRKTSYRKIKVEPEIEAAIQHMQENKVMEYSTPLGDGVAAIYSMNNDKEGSAYLILQLNEPLSDAHACLASGVVKVNINFFKQLEASQIDELTGLANRKMFDDTIKNIYELSYANDHKDSGESESEVADKYWLVMIGIDQYEDVINNYGHLYGDEVLVQVAMLTRECFHEKDMIFRFGGEDFVVILRSKHRATCEESIKRLQESIAAYDFPDVDDITVSTGVTEIIIDSLRVNLMETVDQALHYSQDDTGNRITFFEDINATDGAP